MLLLLLSVQQQNQVAATLDRAKQVTVAELNAIIGVGSTRLISMCSPAEIFFQQQMHAQGSTFPHSHGQTPHFGGSPFGMPGAAGLSPGLLALQGVAAAAQQAFLKDEKG